MLPSKEIADASTIFGLDIGGANLKACCVQLNGLPMLCSASVGFPMWKEEQRLASGLRQLCESIVPLGASNKLAVTMTGELADCFSCRREGVHEILAATELAFPDAEVHVYAVGGEWLSTDQARKNPWSVAASNWHATAEWLCRLQATSLKLPSRFLLVDIGSTTCDVIPVCAQQVATEAATDFERLLAKQLVYTGYERTPVAAIVQHLSVVDRVCPVMAERFADSVDAYLVLGLVEEEPQNSDTADGRPRTRSFAEARLARMIGEDAERLQTHVLQDLARQVIEAQVEKIVAAIEHNKHVANGENSIVFVGHAHALQSLVEQRLSRNSQAAGHHGSWCYFSLPHFTDKLLDAEVAAGQRRHELVEQISRCAPAWAVAELLRLDQADVVVERS